MLNSSETQVLMSKLGSAKSKSPNIMNIQKKAIKILYPSVCPFCEKICGDMLCESCARKLPIIREPRCKNCGKPITSKQKEYCYDCKGKENSFECGRNLWLHDEMVSSSIYRFKYGGRKVNAVFYAAELNREFGHLIKKWKIEQIIPIPLHRSRKRKRGYNQAELLAKELGKLCDISVDSQSLVRVRATTPQKELTAKQRTTNLKYAFSVKRKSSLSDVVLLIDDIYTTGSTLEEATKCLKKSGVQKVYFLTISIGQGI